MFGPDHYEARAAELEAAAKAVSDSDIRAKYLDLAQSFRELAEAAIRTGDDARHDASACRSSTAREGQPNPPKLFQNVRDGSAPAFPT
jgi:hypothetical protein